MKNSENIPWIIHQVWIGPLEPPTKWLQTWQDLNPNWEYKLWTNEEIFGRKWHNQHIIDEYLRKYYQEVQNAGDDGGDKFVSNLGREFTGEKATLFAWHVLADVLRYEILYEYGGYMPGADSVCIKCIDDKFVGDFDEYTLRTGNLYVSHLKQLKRQYAAGREMSESDMKLVDRYAYENASPILASKPGTPFMKQIIDELHKLQPQDLGEAVDTTGNVFMGKMIRKISAAKIDVG